MRSGERIQLLRLASAWVLSCVFARFLEDNRLVEPPRIAGVGERLQRSRDERELYFRSHLTETDREYLLDVFNGLAKLPGARDIFGEHNSIRELPNWLSGDAAGELLKFFQRVDAETGKLVHDFTDHELINESLTYSKEPPPIQLGQRAFEIVMARKIAAGELETTWFDRHGSTPITELPAE